MPNNQQRQVSRATDRFGLLFLSLVVTIAIGTALDRPPIGRLLMQGCFTLVFITGTLANRHRPYVFRSALLLATISILVGWSSVAIGLRMLSYADSILEITFFLFTASMILTAVLSDRMSRVQAVYGALCVYLLLGLSWAVAYQTVELIDSQSFSFVERQLDSNAAPGQEITSFSQMVYFSFVTMSTLGYGDITPRTRLAQTVSWMQSVTGQLYLAILIARLVSELPSRRDE